MNEKKKKKKKNWTSAVLLYRTGVSRGEEGETNEAMEEKQRGKEVM